MGTWGAFVCCRRYILRSMTDHYIKEFLAAEVRAERARKKMTQVELGEAAGLSNATIVRLENGQRSLGVEQFIKISNALGVQASDLLARAAKEARSAGHEVPDAFDPDRNRPT